MASPVKLFDGDISTENPSFIDYVKTNIDETVTFDTYKHMSMFEGVLAHHGLYTRRFAKKSEKAERIVYDKDGSLKSKIEYYNKPQLLAVYESRKSLEAQFNHNNLEFVGSSEVNPELDDGAEAVAKYLTKIWHINTRKHAEMSRIAHWWSGRMILRTTLDEENRPQSIFVSPFSWFYAKDFTVNPEDASYQFTRVFASPQKAYQAVADKFTSYEDFRTKTGAYSQRWDTIFDPSVVLNNLYLAKVDPETRNILAYLFPDLNEFVYFSPWEKIPVYEYWDKALGIKLIRVGDWFSEPETLFEFGTQEEFEKKSNKYRYPITGTFFNRDGYTVDGVSDVEQTIPYEKVLNNILNQTLKSYRTQTDPWILMKQVGPNPIILEKNDGFDGNLMTIKNTGGDALASQVYKVDQSVDFNIHTLMRDIFDGRILRGMGTSPTLELQPVKYSTAAEIGQIQQNAYASIAKKNMQMLDFYEDVAYKMAKLLVENISIINRRVEKIDGALFYYMPNVKVIEKPDYWLYSIKTNNGELKFYRDKLIADISTIFENQNQMTELMSGLNMPTQSTSEKPTMSYADFITAIGRGAPIYVFIPSELENLEMAITLNAREGVLSEKTLQARQILQFMPYVRNERMQLGLLSKAMKLSDIDPKNLFDESKVLEDIERQAMAEQSRVDLAKTQNQQIGATVPAASTAEVNPYADLQSQTGEMPATSFQDAFSTEAAANVAPGEADQLTEQML